MTASPSTSKIKAMYIAVFIAIKHADEVATLPSQLAYFATVLRSNRKREVQRVLWLGKLALLPLLPLLGEIVQADDPLAC
jgi:hypothetical protein